MLSHRQALFFSMPFLFGDTPSRKGGGVGNMDAEEKLQGLTVSVTCCYSHQAVMLLLVAKAALHDGGTEIADYAPGGSEICLLLLGYRSFFYETSGDIVFSAVSTIFVVGINGICSYQSGIQAGQFLMIFH